MPDPPPMSRIETSPTSASRSVSAAIFATGTDCAAMAWTNSSQWGLSATSTVASDNGPPARTTSGSPAKVTMWASRLAGANPLNSPSQVLWPMLGARYRERYAVMTDVDGVTREDSLPGWGNDGTNSAEYRERSWPGWRAS